MCVGEEGWGTGLVGYPADSDCGVAGGSRSVLPREAFQGKG